MLRLSKGLRVLGLSRERMWDNGNQDRTELTLFLSTRIPMSSRLEDRGPRPSELCLPSRKSPDIRVYTCRYPNHAAHAFLSRTHLYMTWAKERQQSAWGRTGDSLGLDRRWRCDHYTPWIPARKPLPEIVIWGSPQRKALPEVLAALGVIGSLSFPNGNWWVEDIQKKVGYFIVFLFVHMEGFDQILDFLDYYLLLLRLAITPWWSDFLCSWVDVIVVLGLDYSCGYFSGGVSEAAHLIPDLTSGGSKSIN